MPQQQTTLQNSAYYSRLNWQPRQKRIQTTKFEINSTALIISFIIFSALITIMTLFFSGKEVTKGYTIKRLEATRQTLTKESEIIGSKVAGAQAMQVALTSNHAQSMINLTEKRITYLRRESNLAQQFRSINGGSF